MPVHIVGKIFSLLVSVGTMYSIIVLVGKMYSLLVSVGRMYSLIMPVVGMMYVWFVLNLWPLYTIRILPI